MFCKTENIPHFLVSAKNGEGVNDLFLTLAEQLNKKRSSTSFQLANRRNPRLHIESKESEKTEDNKKKKCCG